MKATLLPKSFLLLSSLLTLNTLLTAQNVGIGTTTPTNTLEIKSALLNTSGLRFTNLTLASPQTTSNGKSLSVDANGDVILVPSSTDAWLLTGNANATATSFLGTTNAFDVVFKAANAEAMRILNSNGNVGIGTATPTEKLDVVGNLKFSGALVPNGLAGTAGQVLTSAGVGVAPTWATTTVSNTVVGNTLTTTVNGVVGTAVTLPTSPATTNTLSSAVNTITSTVNGVVATAPIVNTLVDAYNTTTGVFNTTINGVAGNNVTLPTNKAMGDSVRSLAWLLNGNAGTMPTTNFVGTTDAQDLVFKTNNAETMRILTNGKVGVNSINPPNLFTNITATDAFANVSSEFTGQNAKSLSWYNDANGYVAAFSNIATLGGANGVQIRTAGATANQKILALGTGVSSVPNTNTEVMTVLGNGNVGIGTTAPVTSLHVITNSVVNSATISRFERAGATGFFDLHSGGIIGDWSGLTLAGDKSFIFSNDNDPTIDDASGLVIAPWTDGANATGSNKGIKIMENGNVGIGAASPLALLDVQLGAFLKTALNVSKNFGGLSNTDAAFIGGIDVGYTNTGVYVLQKDNVSFTSANTNIFNTVLNSNSLFIVKGNGNVGINNSTPAYRLQVKGDVVAEDGAYARSSFNVGYSSSAVITDIIEPWTDNGIKVYDGNSNSHLHIEAIGSTIIQSYSTAGSAKGALENTSYSDLFLQNRGANVCIGNVTPPSKLTVVADGGDGITIQSTGSDAGDLIFKEVGGFEKSRVYSNPTAGLTGLIITTDLTVQGNITATGTITPSDARYKENVVTLTNALSNVLQLRGVTYDMKKEFKAKGFGNGKQVGVIAQEVEKIYPQLVNTGADGYKGVDYSKFTPLLIEAIKEQQQQIETLKSKEQYYIILERKINELNAKYDILLKENEKK